MYFRTKQSNKFETKKRIFESLQSSGYVALGQFNENKCALNQSESQYGLIYGTCLPGQFPKNKCEVLSVEIKPSGCGHQVYLGCTRLCRIKPLAQQVYEALDSEFVVCSV